jgi:hypothetical protein
MAFLFPSHVSGHRVFLTRDRLVIANSNETTYALPHQRRAFAEDLVKRAQALPGVESAAVMNIAPHTWQSLGSPFTIEGRPPADSAQQPFCLVESVGPDYFRALRIPLVGGRGITALDGPDAAPVAVISQALARRYFPNENPLGQRIKLKIGTESLTVVGLAADFHQHIYDREPRPASYVPYSQMPTESLDLAVRAGSRDAALIPLARAVVRALDPQQPVYEARTLTQMIEVWELFGMRLAASMMAALGLLALVLASVGLYGVALLPSAPPVKLYSAVSWPLGSSLNTTPQPSPQADAPPSSVVP